MSETMPTDEFLARCAQSVRIRGHYGRNDYWRSTARCAWGRDDGEPTDADRGRGLAVRATALANLPGNDYGKSLGAALRLDTVTECDAHVVASAFGLVPRVEAERVLSGLPKIEHIGCYGDSVRLTAKVVWARVKRRNTRQGTAYTTAFIGATAEGALVYWEKRANLADMVGQSVSLRARVEGHWSQREGFDTVTQLSRVKIG